MTPEEHFRRLRGRDAWDLGDEAQAVAGAAPRRSGGPIWLTAAVAVTLVLASVLAIRAAAPAATGSGPAGPGVSTTESASPAQPTPIPSWSRYVTVPPTGEPTPIPSSSAYVTAPPTDEPTPLAEPTEAGSGAAVEPAPSDPSTPLAEPTAAPTRSASARASFEYVLADPADVARAKRVLACLRDHGVRLVELTPDDGTGIGYIAYGGADNDRRSIELGLRYQQTCDEPR